jgi:Holliday junction resolvase-like predicted endonuclease
MHITRKERGYAGELLTQEHYIAQGYHLLDTNYTIRGGEVDLVLWTPERDTLVFVEVKVVDGMSDDVLGYITTSKRRALSRVIQRFVHHHQYDAYELRVDVVFVRQNRIYEQYENVMI